MFQLNNVFVVCYYSQKIEIQPESMAHVEPDYDDFVRGLRLLHSRAPESSDELKRLLEQYYVRTQNIVSWFTLCFVFLFAI